MTDVNIKKLKVVFVDWFVTLTSTMFLSKLKQRDPELFEKIDNKIFVENFDTWHFDWARGRISKEDVAYLIAAEGYSSYGEVLKIFDECCSIQQVDHPDKLWPVVDKIRAKGIKVVLATDNWDIFCDYTVPALKLREHFDEILSSNELGFIKRDMHDGRLFFFDDYLKDNHIAYEEAVLLDDAPVNIDCCEVCGMPAKLVASSADTLEVLKEIAEAE